MGYPRDIAALRQCLGTGPPLRFAFFLEPDPVGATLGSGCLSQWYAAPMEIDGVRFPTAEHYMMWRKAQLFEDDAVAHEILADKSPAVAKQLGRKVRGFSAERWNQHRVDVVLRGSVAKFQQHAQRRRYLLQTGDRVLAEASPVDHIWGIGFEATDPRARNPLVWTGLNLLGFTLMQAREHFSRDEPTHA